MNFKILLLCIFLLLGTQNIFAAFEDIDISAEAEKVAEACTAKPIGAASIFYNPAALANITQKEINMQYSFLYVDLQNDNLNYLNILLALPFNYFNTCLSYNKLTSNLYSEQIISFAAAANILNFMKKDLSTGIRLKLLKVGYQENDYTQIEQLFINNGYSKTVFGVDWGILLYSDKGFSYGLNIKNINSPDVSLDSSGSTVPLDLKIGTGYDLAFKNKVGAMDDIKFNLDFDYQDIDYSFRLGIEPSFFNYALMPGLGFGIGNNDLIFLSSGLTYRLLITGENIHQQAYSYTLKINYAFKFYLGGQSLGTYGDHYLSVSFSF